MSSLTEQRRRLNFPVAKNPHPLPRLFAISDEKRGPEPLDLIARLPKGCGLVFRHYDTPNRPLLAAAVVKACRMRSIRCLIAGDVRLAARLKADGVHLPEWQLRRPVYGLKSFQAQGGWVSAAAHSFAAARLAEKRNVDAIFLSPVFATKSHPNAPHLGLVRFSRLNQHLARPTFALGGVRLTSARALRFAGAYGMAGIGLFEECTQS